MSTTLTSFACLGGDAFAVIDLAGEVFAGDFDKVGGFVLANNRNQKVIFRNKLDFDATYVVGETMPERAPSWVATWSWEARAFSVACLHCLLLMSSLPRALYC